MLYLSRQVAFICKHCNEFCAGRVYVLPSRDRHNIEPNVKQTLTCSKCKNVGSTATRRHVLGIPVKYRESKVRSWNDVKEIIRV